MRAIIARRRPRASAVTALVLAVGLVAGAAPGAGAAEPAVWQERPLSDEELQGMGCLLLGGTGLSAALYGGGINTVNIISGGLVSPANVIVASVALVGVSFLTFCEVGQALTPVALMAYQRIGGGEPPTMLARVPRTAPAEPLPDSDADRWRARRWLEPAIVSIADRRAAPRYALPPAPPAPQPEPGWAGQVADASAAGVSRLGEALIAGWRATVTGVSAALPAD